MLRHQRQEVTGVVVNCKLQAPRPLRRQLRQTNYYIEKYGLDNHVARMNETRSNYALHLLGLANFVLFVNPNDRDALRLRETIREFRSTTP